MREIIVSKREEGQQLLKLLSKYLTTAPVSFFHKMLRKKNITLNGMRAEGKEKTVAGDCIRIFVSDDTLRTFGGEVLLQESTQETGQENAPEVSAAKLRNASVSSETFGFGIVYEDEHILLANKPAGMLTQKAQKEDVSLNEKIIDYLLATGKVTAQELKTFRPGVCNRLDRNTSGIVAAGKTIAGLQFLSAAFRERSIHKYYTCLAAGKLSEPLSLSGWLAKDEAENKVTVYTTEQIAEELKQHPKEYDAIRTNYRPLQVLSDVTYLEVELITGKPHQIRAHLASIGHPILGDTKYAGGYRTDRSLSLKHQLLHAGRLVFASDNPAPFSYLNGAAFTAEEPEQFQTVKRKLGL